LANDLRSETQPRGAELKAAYAKGVVWVVAVSLLSWAAFALNSSDRKSIKSSESEAVETVSRVKETCGNKALKFSFDWQGYGDLDYTVGGVPRAQALSFAGERANRVGNAIIALCREDPKWKAALSSITEIRFSPQSEAREFRYLMTREGDRIDVRYGAFGAAADQDLLAELRKLYPKIN
jgi:hypothetical protein